MLLPSDTLKCPYSEVGLVVTTGTGVVVAFINVDDVGLLIFEVGVAGLSVPITSLDLSITTPGKYIRNLKQLWF